MPSIAAIISYLDCRQTPSRAGSSIFNCAKIPQLRRNCNKSAENKNTTDQSGTNTWERVVALKTNRWSANACAMIKRDQAIPNFSSFLSHQLFPTRKYTMPTPETAEKRANLALLYLHLYLAHRSGNEKKLTFLRAILLFFFFFIWNKQNRKVKVSKLTLGRGPSLDLAWL